MKKLLAIVLCIVFVFVCTACRNEEETARREITVSILGDAEWLESDGTFINGVRLAEEDLNAEYSGSGFIIKTNVVDDSAQYITGVEEASRLADDPAVTAVLNLQDFDVSKITAGILTDGGKLTVFPYGAYDSLFAWNNGAVFCCVPSFSVLGSAMADYADSRGYKRIAVYHNGNQSQEDLAVAFELGLQDSDAKVVDYVPSIASQDDFDGIYARWRTLGVDCVVLTQYGTDRAFQVLKMLRSADPAIPVIGEPVFNSAGALAAYKQIAEGMAVPSALAMDDSGQLRDFQERYAQKYGTEADTWSVQGYDALRLIVDTALRLDTNDPAKIAQALHANGYQGIGQSFAFDEGGALITDAGRLPILICRDGVFA
jgi:branched-chain amino acid transport system substrate-binding protein